MHCVSLRVGHIKHTGPAGSRRRESNFDLVHSLAEELQQGYLCNVETPQCMRERLWEDAPENAGNSVLNPPLFRQRPTACLLLPWKLRCMNPHTAMAIADLELGSEDQTHKHRDDDLGQGAQELLGPLPMPAACM